MNLDERAIDLVTADLLARIKADEPTAMEELRSLVARAMSKATSAPQFVLRDNQRWGDQYQPAPMRPILSPTVGDPGHPWGSDIRCGTFSLEGRGATATSAQTRSASIS